MNPLRKTRSHAMAATRNIAILALIVLATLVVAGTAARAAQAPVVLGTTNSFAVLAGSTITNTGTTVISGDVGLHPGTETPGFPLVVHSGELHVADAVALQAKSDLVTAFNDAAGRGPSTSKPTELGGSTLTAGVYSSPTFGIAGTLTLDAQGDPNAVFIFQTESTLITATVSRVSLINGASPCNVYWKVGSSATLGTGTDFKGTIMALASITLVTGARIEGRALARNGAVTMDTNVINRGSCATTPTPTPTSTVSPTPGPSPTDSPGVIPVPTDVVPPGLTPTPTDSAPPGATPTPTDTGPLARTPAPTAPDANEASVHRSLAQTGASIGALVLTAIGLLTGGQFLRRRGRATEE